MFRPSPPSSMKRSRKLLIEPLDERSLPSFVAAPSFTVGPAGGANSNPVALATGDFNRDGKTDVVTANSNGKGLSILLGNGASGFSASINLLPGASLSAIHVADLNGDGKADLLAADKSANTVTLMLGNGAGGFVKSGVLTVGSGPVAIATGDFNGDGHLDFATANNGTSTVSVLFGNGLGKFPTNGTVTVGSNPTSIVAADFNGDLRPDIATVSNGFGHLDVNLNNGDGTFAAKVNYATGFVANTVVTGDFNGDLRPDLAVACDFPSSDGVSILLGNANGTFQPFTKYDAGGQTPAKIAIADLNGDGFKDLVTANGQFANNSVSILPGVGDGTFGPASVYTGGQGPNAIAVGDFNGDGLPDVVTADTGTPVGLAAVAAGTVTLMLGNGDGSLVAAPNLTVDNPGPIITSDLTGDGKPDLAVVTGGVSYSGVTIFPGLGNGLYGPRVLTTPISQPKALLTGPLTGAGKKDLAVATGLGVTILPANGDGTFGTRVDIAIGSLPTWLAIDDLNGDTNSDLIVATGNGVSIVTGNGNGTFNTPVSVAAGGSATFVTTADFNGDGKRDLAVVNESAKTVSILFGNGDGTFGVPTPYATRVGPKSLALGDFNRDGKTDFAVPTFFGVGGNSAMAVFLNGVAGKFTQKAEYATDSRPVGTAVADFTGDGKVDVAVANNFSDNLYVFGGTGVGTLAAAPARYVVGDRPTWMTAGDLNGDGKPDIAVVNSNSNSITLLQTPTPVSGFRVTTSPGVVSAGRSVVVTVRAVDAAGRLLPSFTGGVTFTSTDPKATLPGRTLFSAADKGVKKVTVILRTSGSQDVAAHFGGASGTGTTLVNALSATRLGLTMPATRVAGGSFDVTVAALDVYGNPDPNFTGVVRFTSNDPSTLVTLPANYQFSVADEGVHTFVGGVALRTAGLRTLTVTTLGKPLVKGSKTLTVTADVLAGFNLIGFPTVVAANTARSFTLVAVDAYGNTITNYVGTVQFSVVGGTGKLPPPTAFTLANKGRRVFTATLMTPGINQELVATDTVDGAITGRQKDITVK